MCIKREYLWKKKLIINYENIVCNIMNYVNIKGVRFSQWNYAKNNI